MKSLTREPAKALVLLTGMLLYQAAFAQFSVAIHGYESSTNTVELLRAGVAALCVFALPLVSIWVLTQSRLSKNGASSRMRMVLHILSCLPPLYTLTYVLCLYGGIPESFTRVWWVVAAFLTCITYLFPPSQPVPKTHYMAMLRVLHGVAAVILIGGFLAIHIVNHLFALWNAEAHIAVMEKLRPWYRNVWVEAILLAVAGFLILSGFNMALKQVRASGDSFRMLQTATGSYLGIFMVTHVLAVLGARGSGVDTNWYFAVGEAGLISGLNILLPYYALSVYFGFVHIGLGLRQVLIAHKIRANRAKLALQLASTLGLGFCVAITAATVGFSF